MRAVARFVVQRHDSRHLHYDFRVEIDGSFKSWTLPKGPPLNAGERRLAIRTADHDLAFGDFAGTIPEGAYGAGIITIWDHGEYASDDDPRVALAREDVCVILNGEHLKGRFRLMRPHHVKWRDRMNPKEWLLINDGPL